MPDKVIIISVFRNLSLSERKCFYFTNSSRHTLGSYYFSFIKASLSAHWSAFSVKNPAAPTVACFYASRIHELKNEVCCCGASGGSKQQHNQDLRRIHYIEAAANSRLHHFLPECIAFNQRALRHEQHEVVIPSSRHPFSRGFQCAK